MTKIEDLRPEFVDFIPESLTPGILYISRRYKTASHLCCCGCGNKVVTPLKPGGWSVALNRGLVTVYPSVGSWNLPCQSHYFVRNGSVVWARKWSRQEIEAGRVSDRIARERHFDARHRGVWQRLGDWISRLLNRQ